MSLGEQFFRASTPDGRQTVDVVLDDKSDGNVEFYCRVIVNGDWKHPIEELRTANRPKMLGWMKTQMIQMMRRSPK